MTSDVSGSFGGRSSPVTSSSIIPTENEFYVSVELYLSRAAAAARKPQPPRKKTEKRESLRSSSSTNDLNQKKVKEKSSWLGLSRGPSGIEQWRSATCKLVEEDEGCLLNVYLDDTALYQTVNVHLLKHTDIRRVHHSLFERKECLGIFCDPYNTQTWSTNPHSEPLYLNFPNPEVLNTWIAVLRSYATPEIYGRWLSAPEGGLYRMWRQVELTCQQGKNLGMSRHVGEDPFSGESGPSPEPDPVEIDVYCEIYVNGQLSGRTTVKRSLGSPDWHEKFIFPDLPPFQNLEIVVFREKRLMKPILIGSAVIPLMNFRRGEHVEGWFPVLGGQTFAGIVMGEVKMKLKVDEEIILPYAVYSKLLQTLQAKNLLDWIYEIECKLQIKNVLEHIVPIARAKNILIKNLIELADREVDGTLRTHTTLFRGNTVFTRTMEALMSMQGATFLEASVGSVIRRLCSEKIAIEIDPVRSGKNPKNIERHTDLLVHWCQEFWRSIYDARKQCPADMRKLFAHIRMLIETRYGAREDKHRDLPWQGVSSFLFLRFFVPAILHPHMFGIWPGLTDEPVRRSLTLIAKVLQSLANLNTTLQKENYMRPVKEFLTSRCTSMVDYIVSVSSLGGDPTEALIPQGMDTHERIRMINTLNQRVSKLPALTKEAMPLLPHMLDIPKHLAVMTSVVVRHTRKPLPAKTGAMAEHDFDEFCSICLQVEEQALFRVSQLARRRKHQPPASISFFHTPSSLQMAIPSRDRKSSLPSSSPSEQKHRRPPTAPYNPGIPDTSDITMSPDATAGITRILSRTSLSDARQSSVQSSSMGGHVTAGSVGEPQSLPIPRPAFTHHPRSSSTDSALVRIDQKTSGSPSTPLAYVSPDANYDSMEGIRSRKSLFRGILRR